MVHCVQSIALVQRKLILLTFRRHKWSDIGRTPADIMHIVWVEIDPEVVGRIVFIAFIAKANGIACNMADNNDTTTVSLHLAELIVTNEIL